MTHDEPVPVALRHVTARTCAVCGETLPSDGRRAFCSSRRRQAGYRRRQGVQPLRIAALPAGGRRDVTVYAFWIGALVDHGPEILAALDHSSLVALGHRLGTAVQPDDRVYTALGHVGTRIIETAGGPAEVAAVSALVDVVHAAPRGPGRDASARALGDALRGVVAQHPTWARLTANAGSPALAGLLASIQGEGHQAASIE